MRTNTSWTRAGCFRIVNSWDEERAPTAYGDVRLLHASSSWGRRSSDCKLVLRERELAGNVGRVLAELRRGTRFIRNASWTLVIVSRASNRYCELSDQERGLALL
ncbi:hypothetical protein DY000_02013924 [Brassica cretica]|uniref:Uncharacterized protein n=1 Tax=Brassica cretica TaxID=69181 RepID=A0ABQ7D6S3_BRACR|nr:hypothetical protein DY000_02013924 [Brassica cretica]